MFAPGDKPIFEHKRRFHLRCSPFRLAALRFKQSSSGLYNGRKQMAFLDNFCELNFEDVLKLFTISDERKLTDALARFVAEDLSRMPSINPDSINMLAMAKRVEALESRMKTVEQSMTQTVLAANISNDESELSCIKLSSSETATCTNNNASNHITTDIANLPDVDDNPLPWNKVAGRQRQRSSNTSHASVNTLKKGNGPHKIIGYRQLMTVI